MPYIPYRLREEAGRISCPPPDLISLVVRGETIHGDTLLAYEIRQAQWHPLPVNQVLWRHPHSESEPVRDVSNLRWRQLDAPGKDFSFARRAAATGAAPLLTEGTWATRDTREIHVQRWVRERYRTRTWRVLTRERQEFTVSGADVGPGAKRPPTDMALDVPKREIPQADPGEGLEAFWAAIQWMRQTFDGLVIVKIKNTLGEQGFWVVEGKPRSVAIVRVVSPFGQEAILLEFARPDEYPISTLIVADSLDQEEVNTLLPSLVFREGGWNCSTLDHHWGSHYHLLRHLTRPPERWAALLTDWARIMWGTRSPMV